TVVPGDGHIVNGDGGRVGGQAGLVLHGIADRRRIEREPDLWAEGDNARAVHLPGPLAGYDARRLLARRARIEVHAARLDVVVRIGVVGDHVERDRPRRVVQGAIVDDDRRLLVVIDDHSRRIGLVALGVVHR